MWRWTLLVLLVACEDETSHGGDPDDVECQTMPAQSGCKAYDTCCTVTDGASTACWYELGSETFDCASASNCTAAAQDLVCAACDFTTGC